MGKFCAIGFVPHGTQCYSTENAETLVTNNFFNVMLNIQIHFVYTCKRYLNVLVKCLGVKVWGAGNSPVGHGLRLFVLLLPWGQSLRGWQWPCWSWFKTVCPSVTLGSKSEGLTTALLVMVWDRLSSSHLGVKVRGADNGPVGHGEGVAGAFGHLHTAARHAQADITET